MELVVGSRRSNGGWLALTVAIVLAGCGGSGSGGSGSNADAGNDAARDASDGGSCGGETCAPGTRCCPGCPGAPPFGCVSEGTSCPRLYCADDGGSDDGGSDGGVTCGSRTCTPGQFCCNEVCPGESPYCLDDPSTCRPRPCPPPRECGPDMCFGTQVCCPGCPGQPPVGCADSMDACPMPACPPTDCGGETCAPGTRCCPGCPDAPPLGCIPEGTSCPRLDCSGTCDAMQARGQGSCERLIGVMWDGSRCVPLVGCACTGPDCTNLFTDVPSCERRYLAQGCIRDCRVTGCPDGSNCQVCWSGYACIPEGAIC